MPVSFDTALALRHFGTGCPLALMRIVRVEWAELMRGGLSGERVFRIWLAAFVFDVAPAPGRLLSDPGHLAHARRLIDRRAAARPRLVHG